MKRDVPISDALRFGWEAMKNNIGFFIAFLLIVWVIQAIINTPSNVFRNSTGVYVIFGLLGLVVGVFVNMAYIRVGLRLCDGQMPEYSDIYMSYPLFWKFLGGEILYFLIVLGGLILLIIPGIYFAVKFAFFGYYIVDTGSSPIEALERSWHATDGVWWSVFAYFILTLLIVLAGVLACIVGLFAAIPVVIVGTPYIYRTLAASAAAPQVPVQPGIPPS